MLLIPLLQSCNMLLPCCELCLFQIKLWCICYSGEIKLPIKKVSRILYWHDHDLWHKVVQDGGSAWYKITSSVLAQRKITLAFENVYHSNEMLL